MYTDIGNNLRHHGKHVEYFRTTVILKCKKELPYKLQFYKLYLSIRKMLT